MTCPHCSSGETGRRGRHTSLGYQTFVCRACRSLFNERTGTVFNDLQHPTDIVLLAVLWRLRYKLGFRDVAELLLQRGYEVTHETIRDWEFRFAPLLADQLRAKRRGGAGGSWYLDEAYVKVAGRWCYLYRAIDRDGELLDSMLSEHRDKQAARRFLRRLIEVAGRKPLRVTTDKHPAYRRAIRWILGRTMLHRTKQYLNNYTEQSHRAVKQRYYPMLGFGSFESASRFCAAFDELRQYFRVCLHGEAHVSLAEQRRLFLTRWRSLIAELAAAWGEVGCRGNDVAEPIGDLRSDRTAAKSMKRILDGVEDFRARLGGPDGLARGGLTGDATPPGGRLRGVRRCACA